MKRIQKNFQARVIFAVLSNMMVLMFLILTDGIRYATNDDTTMVALAGGGYGTPSQYVINLHYVLGCVLRGLFTIANRVNWITMLYIAAYLLAAVTVEMVLADKISSKGSYVFSVSIVNITFLVNMGCFAFTMAAYATIGAGLVAVAYMCRRWGVLGKRRRILFAIFASTSYLIGMLIRAEAIKSLLIIFAVIVGQDLVCNKSFRTCIVAVLALALMFLSTASSMWLVRLNPIQREFIEWGEKRSAALDCAVVPYGENLSEQGISVAHYSALYGAFNCDEIVMDMDALDALISENISDNKYSFDFGQMLDDHFMIYTNPEHLVEFDYLYRILFLIVMLAGLLFCEKKDSPLIVLLILSVLSTELLFRVIQRAPYRVVVPNYLFAIWLLLTRCTFSEKRIQHLKIVRLESNTVVALLSLSLVTFSLYCNYYHNSFESSALYSDAQRRTLEYMYEHEDKIFLAGDIDAYNLALSMSVWENPGRHGGWRLVGNYETFSVPYYQFMALRGIQEPNHLLKEAVNNENILLVTRYGNSYSQSYTWILTLINELYGINAHFEIVDSIGKTIVDGKIIHDWAIYKIIA